ncbi:hypothetical protein J7384_14285 [Endozoicomonas sp. G2_1]|uniref:hypothetical protein n=1 Tax=Endozoicomonas sp. G2_1 TaxID=2821091 RepID=UPI001ADA8175|nr:hypothetical protein [Endozoicomonas sp. G2_1]MBO9491531.1 hypothetical protein [Endozoicomonas sp. G2_1]
MKVKVFSKELDTNLGKPLFFTKVAHENAELLEVEINKWLEQNPNISIKEIRQTQSGGSWLTAKVVVTLWYE